MEFRIVRDKEYINELKEIISQKYKRKIKKVEEGNRGVDGETWIIYEENNKLFVKIAYLNGHITRVKQSINAIEYMQNNGVKNINKIIKTADKKPYIEFNNGILVIFEYIDGNINYNIPYTRVMKNLIEIYKLGSNNIIQQENFEIENLIKNLNLAINLLGKNESVIKTQVNKYKYQIDNDIKKLIKLQERVKKDGKKFITHGDCCVNVIESVSQDYIIDWDDAMMAPIERDCWFFMNFENKIKDINNMLKNNRNKLFFIK